jgi:two-component system, OmpR family, response regulator
METLMDQTFSALDDSEVLSLTQRGEQELREPGTTLSPVELEALVLVGGGATVEHVLKRAPGNLTPDVLRAGLTKLLEKKLISVDAKLGDNFIDPGDFFTLGKASTAIPEVGEQEHAGIDADAEFLRQNGYYVNMVRKSGVQPKHDAGHKISVLVIEDDPDIINLLQICLKLEGLDTRTASNRDEIVSALRTPPLPDLVLLDVRLPDFDGFDILTRMRRHPAMKTLPVIMLTAEATREAVLKGLVGGADGYVTKPFQIDRLVKAVKTVLGMKIDPDDYGPDRL